MLSKSSLQFVQSFLIIFVFTFVSNIIYNKGSDTFSKVRKEINTKEITEEVANNIQDLVLAEIRYNNTEPVAFFFYQDDYTSRVKFESNSVVTNPSINDITTDPEYSRMLNYHLRGACYQQSIDDLDKSSALYTAFLALDSNPDFPSYYTSCPVFVDTTLIGYLGSFYALDTPARPSIRVSRFEYLSSVIGEALDPYF